MGHDIPTILCLLASIAACCIVDAASVQDSCPLPSQLKRSYDFNWKTRDNEWNNTNAKAAFLQLVLSWSPTFCESLSQQSRDNEFQCRNGKHFGLIVHGLWPQASRAASVRAHPRNCRNEKQLDAVFVKRFYCMMPDEDLIQSQWEKHGTCYYKTANDYYETIEKLYKSLSIPNIAAMKNPTQTDIRNAFLTRNPTLTAAALQVSMTYENRLKEIKICYDFNLQLVRCSL